MDTLMQKTTSQSYIVMYLWPAEHPEWWSWCTHIGINTLDEDGLENHKEACDLIEAVKQTLYQDYLQAYSEATNNVLAV